MFGHFVPETSFQLRVFEQLQLVAQFRKIRDQFGGALVNLRSGLRRRFSSLESAYSVSSAVKSGPAFADVHENVFPVLAVIGESFDDVQEAGD